MKDTKTDKKDETDKKAVEINFDGLVGPTHNYAGLAGKGNVASETYAHTLSHPKEAALQGLEKMVLLMRMGIPQAFIPPQERPNIEFLRNLGFLGTDTEIFEEASRVAPDIFYIANSASSMWTANSATVSPSSDSQDGRVHFTIANLGFHSHRGQEAPMNYQLFKHIFSNQKYFAVHPPLPFPVQYEDEGAANHSRFCLNYGDPGLQLFVYGKSTFDDHERKPKKYPARQTLEASEAVVRLHQLSKRSAIVAKQNPAAIDAGVFHNDVISVGNQNVFLYHEHAFSDTYEVIEYLKNNFQGPLYFLEVLNNELSLEESVSSYLFNSQIVTLDNGTMAIIAPTECLEIKKAEKVINRIIEADNPIQKVYYVNCRESMKNGGGPACLRLRVVLTEEEEKACNHSFFLTEELYQKLTEWVKKHYRDNMTENDLKDPAILQESRRALDELTQILKIGSIYSFQQENPPYPPFQKGGRGDFSLEKGGA